MQSVTRGNVTEVKVVLASIVTVLAAYQVTLMAVGYGKLRLPEALKAREDRLDAREKRLKER